ncbi:MAG: D-glycero-beta-D-manno-heptose 1-phosphate adenylyltransferase [Planctomycetota bacterium]|nr:MAG: D-glycero-beta-D-manno-heptose 1-phosphate adenylyltransferase [Planctomycetota bacterium]
MKYTPLSLQKKIYLNPSDLLPKIQRLKEDRATIVFGNGCFDLLHVGHIRYLFGAKALGDVLIIAVNTDESMRKIKPHRSPLTPDFERMELIAAIEAVDFVLPLREETPISLLQLFQPHIHTKGKDYRLEEIPERSVVLAYGGKVLTVGDPKQHSTTEIVAKISSPPPS